MSRSNLAALLLAGGLALLALYLFTAPPALLAFHSQTGSQDDRLPALRQLKAVSDLYAVSLADNAHRALSSGSWAPAQQALERADAERRQAWAAYLARPKQADEAALARQAQQAMRDTEPLVQREKQALRQQSRDDLITLLRDELYPGIVPVTAVLGALNEQQMLLYETRLRQMTAESGRADVLAGLCLLLAAFSAFWGLRQRTLTGLLRQAVDAMVQGRRPQLPQHDAEGLRHLGIDWTALIDAVDSNNHDRASLQKLHSLVEGLGVVLFVSDRASGRMLEVYGPTEAIYGRPHAHFLNKPMLWRELRQPADHGAVDAGSGCEYQIDRPQGGRAWLREECHALPDEAGQTGRLISVVSDVTHARVAALAAAGASKQALLSPSQEAVVRIDRQGVVCAFNAAAEQLFGYPAGKMIGQPCAELLTPPSQPFPQSRFDAPANGNGVSSATLLGIKASGEKFPLEAIAFLDPGPMPRHCTLVMHDLSERLSAEARLHHISRAIDQIPVAVQVIDLDDQICYVNRAFCRLYRLRAVDVLEQPASLTNAPETPASVFEQQRRALAAGEEWDGELLSKRWDGTVFWISLRRVPIHDAQGRISHVMTLSEDISERRDREELDRRRQEQLAHSARLILMGEMSSALAHEVNQPLTAIAGYCAACAQDLRDDPDAAEAHLRKLNAQVRRAGEIVWRMSDFARAQAQARVPLRLPALIAEVVEWMGKQARRLNIELDTSHVPDNLPPVSGDRLQIEQVLVNLIKNAFDALREQPAGMERRVVVNVDTFPGNGALMVSVRDTGPGLIDSVADNLFKPFITSKPGGVGIGLSICHSIIEDHGGQLWHSQGQDGCTVFHFTLPIHAGDDAQAAGRGMRAGHGGAVAA